MNRKARARQRVAQAEARLLEAAGDKRDKLHRLMNDVTDAHGEEHIEEFRDHIRHLGHFIRFYGAEALWTAIWLRFGVNTWQPEGWGFGPHGEGRYRPGDEWRFLDEKD